MEVYTAATLFLSPSLRVLSLDMPHHNAQILNSLFKSLEATTPWLEHLGLWCYLDLSQEELKSSFSSFIARLQAIKSLDLRFSHVSSTTMTILSTVSKSLTKLSIMERGRSTTQPALSSTLSELNSVSFPLLHSLIAPFSPTLASIHARIAETSSLREISLFVNGGDRFADCVERSLATYNRCRGLKSLLIRYNPISLPSHDPTRDSITSFHLSHLSSPTFSTLTMLSIDGPVSYDLEDKDLQQISRWCPKLQIFSMVTGPIYSFIKPEPKVTLEGMITFARAMIDLDHLVLPINAYPMDVPPNPDSRIPSLSVWDSSYSWFDNPVQVAEILVNHFPFLNCNQESADKSREREGGDDPWVRRYQRSREGFATILEVIRKTRMGPNEPSPDPGTGHDSSHDTNSLGDENVE
ncbi:hypothetical protein FRC03_009223 [Tulasnella sp. 419]|nr:hypothetical protein FRC03_009223 [Tulasnella sp. 419]